MFSTTGFTGSAAIIVASSGINVALDAISGAYSGSGSGAGVTIGSGLAGNGSTDAGSIAAGASTRSAFATGAADFFGPLADFVCLPDDVLRGAVITKSSLCCAAQYSKNWKLQAVFVQCNKSEIKS
jgi:hypothetical protein